MSACSLSLRRAAFAILSLLLAGLSLLAQTPHAGLVGTIRDPSGAVVPAAAVRVRNVGTNIRREATTDARGEFSVPELTPGRYEVTIEKTGFTTLRESGLELQVDQTARLELRLKIGATSESVDVKAEVPLINTENNTRGEVVVSEEISQLPLDGRNFSDLAFLVPGVSESPDTPMQSPFAVNGARADNTDFLIGGISTRDVRSAGPLISPNLDAIQEFKMETAGFSAESGRVGGGVMNMALRSGTNQLHGSLFEYLRNDKFDARNFFAANKLELRRNQFGGMIGGPVWIPKVFNGRDRTFFLFSWESYRQLNGSTSITRVPSVLERQGDFSQTRNAVGNPVYVKDPFATGACTATNAAACFPGNIIPASRFNSISLNMMQYYPLPNRPGQNNFYTSAVPLSYWDGFVAKVDHRLSDKDSLSFQFLPNNPYATAPFSGSAAGGFPDHTQKTQEVAGINHTRMFAPVLINEFRAGLTRATQLTQTNHSGQDYQSQWGITGFTTDPSLEGFPRVSVSGMTDIGDQYQRPWVYAENIYQLSDTLTWVKGRHQIKLGGQALRIQNFSTYNNNIRGYYNFLGNSTTQAFGDFLLGLPDGVTRLVSGPKNYLLDDQYGFFGQDDFRVTPRLTLNLGLRYELPLPVHDKYGRWANFVPALNKIIIASDQTLPNLDALAAGNNLAGRIGLARDNGMPDGLIFTNKKDFAPRFGFAWRPFGGNRTVLRGGYGVFYAQSTQQPAAVNMANIFPFYVTQSVGKTSYTLGAISMSDPFSVLKGATTSSVAFNGVDPQAAPQYMQSWNLTVERQLGSFAALEVAYAGSKGTHLMRSEDINQVLRSPTGKVQRPYPLVNNVVNYYLFDGDSIYTAGMVTLRRRFNHGFFFRTNYVYSKSIDDASKWDAGANGGPQRVQDPNNRHLERGRSNWDVGHNFTMDYSYRIPWHGARFRRALEGWQLTGSGRAHSGMPLTPRISTLTFNNGGAWRPDRLYKGTVPSPTPERWYDVAALPPVPTGVFRFGNAGRNILDGPGLVGINAALLKNIRVREKTSLQFRAEAFNLFNHANFSAPNMSVDQATAGTITNAGSPRQVQFALRLEF